MIKGVLQNIYDSSEWYSAKYAAGKAIGEPVDDKVEEWVGELEKELSAMKKGPRQVPYKVTSCPCQEEPDYHDKVFWGGGSNSREASCELGTTQHKTVYDRDVPDVETRLAAIKDLGELYRLSDYNKKAKEVIDNAFRRNSTSAVISEAGQLLGYSRLRSNINAHYIASPIVGALLGWGGAELILKAVEHFVK